jgi:hypothetical protein
MFEDGGILPGTSVKTLVGSDPPVVLENFRFFRILGGQVGNFSYLPKRIA